MARIAFTLKISRNPRHYRNRQADGKCVPASMRFSLTPRGSSRLVCARPPAAYHAGIGKKPILGWSQSLGTHPPAGPYPQKRWPQCLYVV